MSIEIGHRYVKDDVVVVIKEVGRIGDIDCVVYFDEICRALTVCEFLMEYRPYEVVYEWQWYSIRNGVAYLLERADEEVSFFTDEQIIDRGLSCLVKKIKETKRERKCGR